MAKGEIAHHEQFHRWPQRFQKLSAAIVLKCVCRLERVNPSPHATHMQHMTLKTSRQLGKYINESIDIE